MKTLRTILRLAPSLAALFFLAPSAEAQTSFSLVGYDDLTTYLGPGNVPDGGSISVSIIEAPVAVDTYRIDVADPQLAGKSITFSPTLTPLPAVSWHATNTARYISGSTWSMTPGVTSIYEMPMTGSTSNGYLGSDFLRTSNNFLAPLTETRDIQNHSWVAGSTGVNATDLAIIQRFDYSIATDNYVAVVGVNNASSVAAGAATAIPNLNVNLLSSAYNAISAGRANGFHAYGDTVIPVAGRQRPHIVVDSEVTSWATAITSSAAALLMDGASTIFSGNPSTVAAAKDFRVVKSLIMAGAVKDGLGPSGNSTWTAESSSSPLDEIYGAGRLNILNSYQILAAGRQASSSVSVVDNTGWNFETLDDSAAHYYFFDVTGGTGSSLSISLNWALELTPGGGVNYNAMTASLANLNLAVYAADDFSIIGGPIQISNSSIENLEYIWLTDFAAGRYAIQVTSTSSDIVDYGIAWQTIPEPSSLFLFLGASGASFLLFRRRTRS